MSHSGANSTMNTEMNSEHTNAIETAPIVVSIVLQINGHAWMKYWGTPLTSPDVKIACIWWSTGPPALNQPKPL